MEAWIGLLGAIAGAAIALVGQHVSARSAARERRHTLLLEQASELAALEEDFRNRVWEERHEGSGGCRPRCSVPIDCPAPAPHATLTSRVRG